MLSSLQGARGAVMVSLAAGFACASLASAANAIPQRLPGTGPLPRTQFGEYSPAEDVVQPGSIPYGSGYLPIFGAPPLRFELNTGDFDRSQLVGLRDIVIDPEEEDASDSDELEPADIAAAGGQDVSEEDLLTPAVADTRVPVGGSGLSDPVLGPNRLGDNLAQPLDPAALLRYFEPVPMREGVVLEMPFLLPYQQAPLIMESDARYRQTPAPQNNGGQNQ